MSNDLPLTKSSDLTGLPNRNRLSLLLSITLTGPKSRFTPLPTLDRVLYSDLSLSFFI